MVNKGKNSKWKVFKLTELSFDGDTVCLCVCVCVRERERERCLMKKEI